MDEERVAELMNDETSLGLLPSVLYRSGQLLDIPYLTEKHFEREPGLAGWFGYVKDKQFDLLLEFEHAKCAGGWQISSPCILGSAAIEGALELILEAGIDRIREKSLKMTSYLIYLVENILGCDPYNFFIGTPGDSRRRGGHVAVEHPTEAMRICEALKARGVVPDFRPPDIIRMAPVALYNTYHEIWRVVDLLKEIVGAKEFERFPRRRRVIP